MTEIEFIELARKAGYTEKEIEALVNIPKEQGIPLEEIPLLIHNVD